MIIRNAGRPTLSLKIFKLVERRGRWREIGRTGDGCWRDLQKVVVHTKKKKKKQISSVLTMICSTLAQIDTCLFQTLPALFIRFVCLRTSHNSINVGQP